MGRLDKFLERRFAALALRVARRTPGVQRAEFHPRDFMIEIHRSGESGPARLFLANVFRETAGAPREERRERLEKLLRVMAAEAPEETWASARAKLRPVLRPVTFGTTGQVGMRPPLSRPGPPFLNELIVVDQPDAMAYVTAHQLEGWDVPAATVFEAAHANLAFLARRSLDSRSLDRPWSGERTLITMVDDGDAYFASLLLAPGWVAEVAERMGGPVLVFVPDTSHLLICPLPDGAVEPLYAMVEAHFTDAVRALSPVGYVAALDGRAVPYTPPPGHPHHPATRRAAAVLAATEYTTQTEWLAGQYAEAGLDVHVGALLAVSPGDGGPAQTIATWTEGVATLLPEADTVAFVRPGAGVDFRVPWPVVAEHAGLRPEPLLSPARYRVGDWPPTEVMAELRRHALS
ncbi:MAG: hypothetical protein ABW022_19470 [Actinoplanes sp.]